MTTVPDASLLSSLRQLVGTPHVLVPDDGNDCERHLLDWRKRYRGQALAIVKPANAHEVVEVVKLCTQHGISIVPQGGNTSLVGGSVPDSSGQQIVLSLTRMNRVLQVDSANLSMTVEAGCLLADVQAAAAHEGLLFPLRLASEGTCTIGGNLATNAGGTQVLRYGTARELCLGLEAVTAQGEIWNGLKALRKDNSGYALRDLLIGSEGTLGIITAATLRLYPKPRGTCTALIHCPSLLAATRLLERSRRHLDAGLTAFEVMAAFPLALLRRHEPEAARMLGDTRAPWTVLLEHSSSDSEDHARERLESLLTEAHEQRECVDAVIAANGPQQQAMWLVRESIPLAERTEGLMVKHDIGVPTSSISDFVERTEEAILQRWPEARIVCFGHLADGNLHYNVQPPAAYAHGDALQTFEREVNTVVFDMVDAYQGTISAEHGIGLLRREELARRKPAAALTMMRSIKQALDPHGILNPGRTVPN